MFLHLLRGVGYQSCDVLVIGRQFMADREAFVDIVRGLARACFRLQEQFEDQAADARSVLREMWKKSIFYKFSRIAPSYVLFLSESLFPHPSRTNNLLFFLRAFSTRKMEAFARMKHKEMQATYGLKQLKRRAAQQDSDEEPVAAQQD